MNTGVYEILCASGMRYLGSTRRDFEQRWATHRRQLRQGIHASPQMQNAWNKHGEDAFTFRVIELVEKEKCIEREQFHLDAAVPGTLFNHARIAAGGCGPHTPETRLKMSKTRERQADANRGQKHEPHTDETRRKISEAIARRGEEAEKLRHQRIGDANRGQVRGPPSAETRRKISEGQVNRPPCSPETRQRMSEAHKGKTRGPHSDETRRLMSESAFRREANRRLAREEP
jgi:group I intron endonuclease